MDLEKLKNFTKKCSYIQKQKEELKLTKSKNKHDEASLSFIINRKMSLIIFKK